MSAPDRQTFAPIALILGFVIAYGVYWNITHRGDMQEAADRSPSVHAEAPTDGAADPRRDWPPRLYPRQVPQPQPEILRRRLTDPNVEALDL